MKRPGGRSELVRNSVMAAVLENIRGGNFDFSYQEIADHSGINKTTLYRRWPDRNELLREAIGEHNASFTLPDSQSWEKDVEALVHEMARFFSQPTEIALNLVLFNNPPVKKKNLMMEQWGPVQEQVEQRVRNAQSRGELPHHIEPPSVSLMLLSPLLVLTLMSRKRVDKKNIDQIIELGQHLAHKN